MSDPFADFNSDSFADFNSDSLVAPDRPQASGVVTPQILDSLRRVESSGDPFAVNSKTGAMGAYQFMPGTVAMLHKQGIKFNPFDEKESRTAAETYLNQLVQQNGGDLNKALAQYGGFVTKDPSAYVAKVTAGAAPTAKAAPADPFADFSSKEFGADASSAPSSVKPVAATKVTVAAPANPQQITSPEMDATAHAVSSVVAPVVGGLHGAGKFLSELVKGNGVDKAVDAGVQAMGGTQQALTYTPRTAGGQKLSNTWDSGYNPVQWIPAAAGWLGDKAGHLLADAGAPGAGAVVNGALNAAPLLLGTKAGRSAAGEGMTYLRDFGKTPIPDTATRVDPAVDPSAPKPRYRLDSNGQPVLVTQDTPSQPSPAVAAPAAPPKPTVADASPELQSKVQQAQAKGAPINQEVLSRHVDAETLPVPVKLTEGQATLDPETISMEMNGRGKAKPTVSPDFYNAQGKALAQNMDALRESAAPNATGTNPTEHGQLLVDEYKNMDAAAQADIRAKYKALEDANGGQLPLNGSDFVTAADANLTKINRARFLPSAVRDMLSEYRDGGGMTFNDFENLRTILAAEGRKAARAGDGNAEAAISNVRETLESLPMQGEAANIKPLADAARTAARTRFEKIKTDPAYKAVVNDDAGAGEPSPLADKFVQSFIINGKGANVKRMKANLATSPVAGETISAASLDYLRDLAKADKETGKFLSDRYSNGVRQLGPKLGDIFDPKTAQTVEQLGRVAKYTSAQPKGSYVNNSNSTVAAVAELGKRTVEGAINGAFGGVPIATLARMAAQNRGAAKAAKKSTAPGAGITPD